MTDAGNSTAEEDARRADAAQRAGPRQDGENAADENGAAASEGVIRFGYRMTHLAPFDAPPVETFRRAQRRGLDLGLLGRDPHRYDGLAYGNLSLRSADGFWITASQRIDTPELEAADLVLVTAVVRGGEVLCRGGRPPSSETLTHAAVQSRAQAGPLAVFHGHAPSLWHMPALDWASSPPAAANGTRAMADAVSGAVAAAPERGMLVMRGHQDGILAWAADFAAIIEVLDAALAARRG